MNQRKIFEKGEADAWFRRNRQTLGTKNDLIIKIIDDCNIRPKKILEVGCSNAYRLNKLYEKFRCSCYGVEPSKEAIKDGRLKYPDVKLSYGFAEDLPFENEAFDLVIVSFVFHWISRESLLKALAEIDRVVSEGGYLIISDFLPDTPTKVKYHHLPDKKVYTYKLDYANVFVSTSLYKAQKNIIFDHEGKVVREDINPSSRCKCTILQKSSDGYYVETALKR